MFGSGPILQSFASADAFGKVIFLTLFALSILSWSLLIYKVWVTHRARRLSQAFHRRHVSQNKHPLTWEVPQKDPTAPNCFADIYAHIKEKTVEVLNKNRAAGESRAHVQLSQSDILLVDAQTVSCIRGATQRLEDKLYILSTTTSLAPFLGLLGTVWGILITFGELQQQSMGSSNQAMMAGLSMALATTVLGLLVAIPSLVGHHYLRHYIRDFSIEMEGFSTELLSSIELAYRPALVE